MQCKLDGVLIGLMWNQLEAQQSELGIKYLNLNQMQNLWIT